MGQVIITIIFSIVSTISNFVLSPFINAVFLLFPQLNDYVSYYTSFMNTAFTYVTCICRLLLLDSTLMTVIFTFIVVKYSIWLLFTAVRFTIKAYNYLKP